MKPNTIRIIDKWLGQPICFGLTVVRKVFPARKTKEKGPVLFIKLIEQGATVLANSAIQRAVQNVGRENVYFCVFADNKPILDILDAVPQQNIFSIRQGNFIHFLIDVFGLLIKARRVGINSTIDMEFFSRASAILAYLSGARNRVGLHRFNSEQPYRGDLLTHRVQYNPYLHTARAYLLLVLALESDGKETPLLKLPAQTLKVEPPVFTPAEDEVSRVSNLLEYKWGGEIPSLVFLLNPNASDMLPLRKWDTPNFVTLGKKLLETYPDSGLVLTGAPSEQDACAHILGEFNDPRAIAVAGETTLRELLVLYSLSSFLVTNDSGPGHFASMTEIPTLVLFGPETPALFGPLGDGVEVIWKGLACSPCVNPFNHRFSPCDNNLCMQQITVDEVFAKVRSMLPQNGALE